MPRPKKVLSLTDYGLAENLIGRIQDLCEAFQGAPEHRAVAFALEWYFTKGINDDPALKLRYEEAQRVRLAAKTK